MRPLPLQGITVVAIEQAVAGPFATRQLADLGARVIKIERPDGGDFARGYDGTVNGLASWFVWLNRTKESVTLDLKRPEAPVIIERLLSRADVFVQNLAPGAMDRLDLSTADLRRRHPRLVICNISGYGTSGPMADRKAYDLIIQSEVGLLSITGTDTTPCKVGVSIADISAGMYAYSAVLAALLARKDTGEGTTLDVALLDTLGEWMGYATYYTAYGGASPSRTGARHATIAPYGPYRTCDGAVVIAVQHTRDWRRLCVDVLQHPALADDPRFATNQLRVQHREALDAAIEASLGSLSSAEVVRRLDAADLASARVNSVSDFIDHPQLAARDRWREIDSPAGRIRTLLPPVNIEGTSPALGPVPALGEHTESVLEELRFDRGTIDEWKRTGVV